MSSSNTSDKVLGQLEQLPPDATVEDAMEPLYFLAKVERGLAESEAGQTISHEEAKRRLTGA
jgi:predicted transcriptional regulator